MWLWLQRNLEESIIHAVYVVQCLLTYVHVCLYVVGVHMSYVQIFGIFHFKMYSLYRNIEFTSSPGNQLLERPIQEVNKRVIACGSTVLVSARVAVRVVYWQTITHNTSVSLYVYKCCVRVFVHVCGYVSSRVHLHNTTHHLGTVMCAGLFQCRGTWYVAARPTDIWY